MYRIRAFSLLEHLITLALLRLAQVIALPGLFRFSHGKLSTSAIHATPSISDHRGRITLESEANTCPTT